MLPVRPVRLRTGAAFRHSFDRIAQPDYAVQASLPGKHPLVVVNEEPRRDERACRLHSPFVGDSCGYRMRCARADVSLVENLWAPRAQVNSLGKRSASLVSLQGVNIVSRIRYVSGQSVTRLG